MCILFIAVDQHPQYPLIIAANRDEFFARPTLVSHLWPSESIVAGIDQQAGGTWMGINTSGHLAALTNIRQPSAHSPEACSRGMLVKDYLQLSPKNYLAQLQNTRQKFNGYNLLFGQWHKLQVYNNRLNHVDSLTKGFYGLSNAHINSPWPKLTRGVEQLKDYCTHSRHIDDEALFSLLLDSSQALDADLPHTGIPLEWERTLSSIFVHGSDYGTRSSTLLKIDQHRHVFWRERSFAPGAMCISEQCFEFDII